MQHKGFPHVASLPSFKNNKNENENEDDIPLRAIKVDKSHNLPSKRISTSENAITITRTTPSGRWSHISISSDEDDDEIRDNVNHQLVDFQLPIMMKKQPSMMSLRNRRAQQYQGMRTLKPARVVNKPGNRNITAINLPEKSRRFMKDLVHTLIEAQWRYVLMFFAVAFFGSWLFFGIFYWIIAWSHGDLNFDETGNRLGEGGQACITNAKSFTGFFLFSVETQVTTGYGRWVPTEECSEAIFVLIVQLIIGLVIDAAVVGVFYVKIIRPPKYADFKFSKKAVICQRDSKLCLLFRVADFKQAHAIDTKIRAYLFEEKVTTEGERIGKNQQRIELDNNGRIFLIWPQIVCHYIDKSSPFYDMSAKDLIEKSFEIVVSMTGISRHTGQLTQARTSYLSREILWGYRFKNIVNYDYESHRYITETDKLDETEEVDTVLCSANCLDEILHEMNEIFENEAVNSCDYVNQITKYEEDDDSDDDGIHMKNKSPDDMTTKTNR